MSDCHRIFAAASGCLVWLSATGALAAGAGDAQPLPELVVTADRAGLLERRPTDTVLGLNKALIETPRSASFVSATTLDRYGIYSLDKLTAVSPSTYTASFYGVAGSVDIRGTLAENYFRGFKRIENRGTYATPIGDAAQLQILRGPPQPVMGPGKVGGLVNFIPRSANSQGAYITAPTGEATLTGGSYGKKNATAQAGLPVSLGAVRGGLYLYGEIEDSDSFYRGIHPRRQTGEVSVDFDLGAGWTTSLDGMVFHSTGDIQTPGWNRLTRALIDNGTYITGRNTSLIASPVCSCLTPTAVSPGGFYPFTTSLYTAYFGFTPAIDPRFVLNSGVATATLGTRTVFVSPADFSNTNTQTLYYELAKDLGAGRSVKLQVFYDRLSNRRFVSYGFPADYHAWTTEERITLSLPLSTAGGFIAAQNVVGAADRYYRGEQKESYDSGLISLDRRDLSQGATPTDIFDSPFNNTPGGLQWETDIHSRWNDVGVFETSDITVGGRLNVILGGRYDHYSATSQDTGVFAFETPNAVSGSTDKWTYSASASYRLGLGLRPYVTYDHAAALELEQAGNLRPSTLQNGFVSNSTLAEAGLKFQWLRNTLLGSIDVYRQTRTQLSGLNAITQPTIGKGFEAEIRYLATRNLSFTLTADLQHTEIVGPDHSVVYLPASAVGLPGVAGYGGAFLSFDFSKWGGQPGNYNDSLVPHATGGLYATYTSDDLSWGRFGGTVGATYASKTSGVIPGAVVYPAYALVNMSAFVSHGPYTVAVNVENLLDKRYFTPDQDVYANIAALPGRGREWRVTLKRKF